MATHAGHAIGTRARSAVVVHSAPLVLPVCEPPIENGAVAVRGDRVIRVGPREQIEAVYPESPSTRWPGMIVPGLVDAHLKLDRTPVRAAVHGVTAIAGVAGDPDAASAIGETGLGGVTYLETRCENEALWESEERDRLITAIREVDHPGIIGIAPHSPDPVVMEDLAVLSRTFRLRLLIEVGRHPAAFLDEVGALGPGCHVALSGPLDEADRKLLRIRSTAVAISSPFAAEGLLDGGGVIAFGTRTGGDPLAVARALTRDPVHGRAHVPATDPAAAPTTAPATGPAADPAADRALDRLLVEAVTLGGARALGMAEGTGRLGSLGPGSRADFAVFAVQADERSAYTALLHEGPGRCVATIIGGRPRWRLDGGRDAVEARRLA